MPQARINKIEAQVTAMAHAWLTLVAALEVQEGFDAAGLQESLLQRRWPHRPDLNPEARETLRWLCDQLNESRARRQ